MIIFDKTENDYRLYSKEKIEKGNAATDFRIEDFKIIWENKISKTCDNSAA
ncbi:MAG: hypothetical protein U0T78_05960 [Cloacibacterium normanense]